MTDIKPVRDYEFENELDAALPQTGKATVALRADGDGDESTAGTSPA